MLIFNRKKYLKALMDLNVLIEHPEEMGKTLRAFYIPEADIQKALASPQPHYEMLKRLEAIPNIVHHVGSLSSMMAAAPSAADAQTAAEATELADGW
eukprot:COSAG01_NODE_2067_length_8506_cov_221.825384_10_plen_97_part_00